MNLPIKQLIFFVTVRLSIKSTTQSLFLCRLPSPQSSPLLIEKFLIFLNASLSDMSVALDLFLYYRMVRCSVHVAHSNYSSMRQHSLMTPRFLFCKSTLVGHRALLLRLALRMGDPRSSSYSRSNLPRTSFPLTPSSLILWEIFKLLKNCAHSG